MFTNSYSGFGGRSCQFQQCGNAANSDLSDDKKIHNRSRIFQTSDRFGCGPRGAGNFRCSQFDQVGKRCTIPVQSDRMSGGFPPGSAAIFTVDVAGRCTFEGFIQPRDLGGE